MICICGQTHRSNQDKEWAHSKMERIKRVCAWCKKYLGGDPTSTKVSHGICAKCLKEQEVKL